MQLHGHTVQVLRTDRGSEYDAQETRGTRRARRIGELDRACVELGITHETTPVNQPQLNGIPEAWNNHTFNRANRILFEAALAPKFWSEAVAYANFVRNRLPTRVTSPLSPHELLTGDKPRLDFCRVWGCDGYVRRAHDDAAKAPGSADRMKCLFMGTTAGRVGFRVFIPELKLSLIHI